MRKFVLSTCVLGLLVMGAFPADAAMWAGVKGGVNLADISSDEDVDTDMRNGFSGGAFFGLGINDDFGFQIEGLYVMKGAKGQVGGADATVKVDYIEFPVLLVVMFPAGDTAGFNLFAGPTLGFNIKSELEIEGEATLDLKDATESFEFGAAIGGGFEYMLESFSIIADVRYTIGATEIYQDDTTGDKNRGIAIMAGVKFPLGAQ